jgi:hypothetical protein
MMLTKCEMMIRIFLLFHIWFCFLFQPYCSCWCNIFFKRFVGTSDWKYEHGSLSKWWNIGGDLSAFDVERFEKEAEQQIVGQWYHLECSGSSLWNLGTPMQLRYYIVSGSGSKGKLPWNADNSCNVLHKFTFHVSSVFEIASRWVPQRWTILSYLRDIIFSRRNVYDFRAFYSGCAGAAGKDTELWCCPWL